MDPQIQTGSPKRVAIVAYPGVEPLDVSGPASVFGKAEERRPGSYALTVLSPEGGVVAMSCGLSLAGTEPLSSTGEDWDTVIVAGGEQAALEDAVRSGAPKWLRDAVRARRMASVCTGAFLLAAAGLLDGRRATTHWRAAGLLAKLFPAVHVDADPIHSFDGVYTSAGVTAGIDLALALVAEDHGQDLAAEIARELVVYVRRAGGQAQYSRTLASQAAATPRLQAIVAWIHEHLDEPLDVPRLAMEAGMTERTFARSFVKEVGATPARFVAQLRLDRARTLLESTNWPLARVAERAGFGSVDALERVFRKHLAVTPASCRERFRYGAHNLTPKRSVADEYNPARNRR